jgi:hypothetical protein
MVLIQSHREGEVHMPNTMKWPGDAPRPEKKSGSILINFVLDKSGSMDAVRAATIDGFNEFLKVQRNHGGRAALTLTMFDTEFYEVCRGVPLREVPEMDAANYRPSGCTALYDAVARSIRIADDYLGKVKRRPEQVLFVIMIDGLENASREFTQRQVFEMIQDREQRGYEFVYLGANQDAYAEAQTVGVTSDKARNWVPTDKGARRMHARLNERVSAYRDAAVPHLSQISEDWFERDEHLTDEDDADTGKAAS